MKNLTSPKVVKELIKKHRFRFNKKLGQNFLIDQNILAKIVEGAIIEEEDGVLEIGPGIGTLTQILAEKAGRVLAIEIDRSLSPILSDTLSEHANIKVVYGDVLKLPLRDLLQEHFENKKIKVVANLPYYVTTPIIMKLLEEDLPIESITIMIQKEVAQRIVASPGGKDYGALSIGVQFYARPHIVTTVSPTVFMPAPSVESMVIRLDLLQQPGANVHNKELFFSLVKAAFGKRRKTLLNALSTGGLGIEKKAMQEILNGIGIDGQRRGETLSIQEFENVANYMEIH